MKEFFSKILNWVTVWCLVVWGAIIGIGIAFPEHLDTILNFSYDMIKVVIGALVGAGGVKIKQALESKEEVTPTDPLLGEENGYID